MPEQEAQDRINNFREVPLGYTPEQAVAEASRCLQCKNPKCVEGCPVEVAIPEFIALVRDGLFEEAARKIKETNALPAMCGRVCPQETQCEAVCVLAKKGEAVAVGNLERFAADYEREHGASSQAKRAPRTGMRVAVIGAGPAGLTVAGELAKMGHEVTILEALHKPGGVLVYGIPEFRLPKAILEKEVAYVQGLGVQIECDKVVGKISTIDELLQGGFDAVFVGTGAGLPKFLGIEGENLLGVYSANEYLTRANLMKAYRPDYASPIARRKRVAVIGGGNVAVDAARTARRLGGEEVYIVYRRSEQEMPARAEEVRHARDEGIKFHFLCTPVRIMGNESGWVRGLECRRNRLGPVDASGRRSPVEIPGSAFVIDLELVIVAIGTGPHPLVLQTTPDMELNERGYIQIDPETGQTSKRGVFAGGDIVTGSATVIEAMGAARRAARAIDAFLGEKVPGRCIASK